MTGLPETNVRLHSEVTQDGTISLRLVEEAIPAPQAHQVVILVEAAPIHPADLTFLLAGASPADLVFRGEGLDAEVSGPLPLASLRAAENRIGQSLPIGLEGAGLVVAAGTDASHLLGKRVAAMSPALGMFGRFCTVDAANCLEIPAGLAPHQAAGAFCNPLTALAIVETLHQTSRRALVHTAAASNLGQMLVRICAQDDIALVNIVRRPEQADLLREMGAEHVCDSSAPSFRDDLLAALRRTEATIAFDAIGGGTMAGGLLAAMETAALARSSGFNPYGTSEDKRVYIYGRLDPSAILIEKGGHGMVWGVEGWAMPPILERAGSERASALRERIAQGLTTTFASRYSQQISLAQMLQPAALLDYCRQATGGKYLLNPQLALV